MDAADSLWDGLDQFASWTDLRSAIIAHFRPLAQRKHVDLLNHLRFRPSAGRQFRQSFLQIIAKLEPAFRPNDADLLTKLQLAQYPKLASMPSVIMYQGRCRWMPAQWPELLAAMIDADAALAETAQPGGAVTPPGPGTSATPRPSHGKGKGKRSYAGAVGQPPAKRPSAVQRPHGAAGPSSMVGSAGSAGAAQDRAERFRELVWADPAVQRAAEKGNCLNCLQPGHFARNCPKPKVVRKKVHAPAAAPGSKNV
jgi:hypothetical protein